MRTVKIYAEIPAGVPAHIYQRCLGRLATYAADFYKYVSIANDGRKNDLVAAYKPTEESEKSYVIGAIWDDRSQEYSFHS